MRERNKRGQVTLFIILGIVLVAGITATFVLLSGTEPKTNTPEILGPKAFVDKCVKDAVKAPIEKILAGGGEMDPEFEIRYMGDDYRYLCYSGSNYKSCVNLHPMLKYDIEKLLVSNTSIIVSDCFHAMREDFENRGYDVTGDSINYSVNILPGEIRININAPITISKEGSSQSFENFNTKIISQLYDIIRVTRRILNSEANFCYFEKNGYMMQFPWVEIIRTEYHDNKIYQVIDRKSGMEFKFAVRTCTLPIGIM